jgi:CRP/FNR family transcriptional regulator
MTTPQAMHRIKPEDLQSARQTHCADCALSAICLPPAVHADELTQLDAIMERGRPMTRGAELFHQGQVFDHVYAVRSGAVKMSLLHSHGDEQITGFFLPGEIIGLDSIGHGNYHATAIALETTSVCAIPYLDLKSLGRLLPSLQDHLLQLMSTEIRHEHRALHMFSKRPAEERLASFLLSLSARHKRRQLSAERLHLPMSRADMANYLGLALETVSRLLTRLQLAGLLSVSGRDITILDRTRLLALIEGV